MSNLVKHDFNGVEVAFKGKEMINLTDLWKASGSPNNQDPAQWLRTVQAVKLLATIEATSDMGKSHIVKKAKGGQGGGGGTWAIFDVALTYAAYLSPQLQIWINKVVKERIEEERDPELGFNRSRERAVKAWKGQGKDDKWIEARLKGMATRKVFTGILQSHGVKFSGFAQCTNAIYEPMLGNSAAIIREQRGLKPKDNLRDKLGNIETIGIMLAEALAGEKIEGRNYQGNDKCASACMVASYTVAKAIKDTRLS